MQLPLSTATTAPAQPTAVVPTPKTSTTASGDVSSPTEASSQEAKLTEAQQKTMESTANVFSGLIRQGE